MRANWLGLPADLWRLTAADFVVRTAYQMGKTPLLPIYAAALGAGDLIIGAVVSISTMTGLVLKPLFGFLSDRWGRRLWLLIGLTVFALAPFLYRFVETPEDLIALRLLHGTATAIFGPVSLAYVAEMGIDRRAERLGIFGMARSGGYLLAPTIAALLLTVMEPEKVFTIIGLASCAAFVPALFLTQRPVVRHESFVTGALSAIRATRSSRAFWMAATLEIAVHVATYATKAFLPIYALTVAGFDLLLVGLFFSVQELANIVMRPIGGRLADRTSPELTITAGLVTLACALLFLSNSGSAALLLAAAVAIGLGLGLILPSTQSLLSSEIPAASLGAGMGALGALRNLGKVAGPVAAGLALTQMSYEGLFTLCAGFVLITALIFGLVMRLKNRSAVVREGVKRWNETG